MDEIYNFRDYWKSLRRDAGCAAGEALWIILDDINEAENEFLYKDHGGRADEGFFEFLEDCKSAAKTRIRYKKNGIL